MAGPNRFHKLHVRKHMPKPGQFRATQEDKPATPTSGFSADFWAAMRAQASIGRVDELVFEQMTSPETPVVHYDPAPPGMDWTQIASQRHVAGQPLIDPALFERALERAMAQVGRDRERE